ncbi:MAG: hypothetical protein JWR80_5279 [Bradyrhizobium sp.]|nr:hypothetical protein [Bradyrhizobium sp.]
MEFGKFARQAPRLLLGALFVVSGVTGWIGLFVGHELISPPAAPAMESFVHGLMAFQPFWALLRTIELGGGLLLLSGRYAPIGALVVAPVATVVILLQLLLNAPAGLPVAIVLIVLQALCLWSYRGRYALLIDAPGAGTRRPAA